MKYKLISFLCFFIVFFYSISFSKELTHIEKLFDIREEITTQGKSIPILIKEAQYMDIRTFERIFELNTSILSTIEAYFRMVKISIIKKNNNNPKIIEILNNWLNFINNQCTYDLEYLNSSLPQSNNKECIEQIQIAIKNIENLYEITKLGIQENKS